MYDMDVFLTQAINGLAGRSGIVDLAMIWVTGIGIPLLVLAVVVQWWRGPETGRRHLRHVLVATGLSFLLGELFNQIIGTPLDRVRPYAVGVSHLLIAPSPDFSFPSDHATAGMAIAFAFALHGMRRMGLLFGIAAAGVCISRIYVGTHYASDVLGGICTGLLAALLVRGFYVEGTKVDQRVTGIL